MRPIWETQQVGAQLKVSTSEEVLEQIKKLPRPVCIVVFGADCGLKNYVLEILKNTFLEMRELKNYVPTHLPKEEFFRKNQMTQVILSPIAASMYRLRHNYMQAIRSKGVRSIAQIYVWPEKVAITSLEAMERNFQIEAIYEAHPMEIDDVDLLIRIQDKEGEEYVREQNNQNSLERPNGTSGIISDGSRARNGRRPHSGWSRPQRYGGLRKAKI